jgi:KaiC domain protein
MSGEDDWFEEALQEDGSSRSGDDRFGGSSDGGATAETEPADAEPFEEDFASAFEGASGPDEDFATGFDGDPYESDLSRIDIGIEGLDNMIQGGVPERSLMVALGAAGTGKTTFGLQFIHHGLEQGESAVFIALEETHDGVVSTADDRGWNFSEYVADDQLAVIDLDPIEMANSLASIRSELPSLVNEFGATRLVLDSVSLLEMMYEGQATRRNQIFDFTQSLKRAGVTTMLTSEASEQTAYASRFGIIEYLTDAVFVLRYIRPEDFRETRLAVEIQKIRNANHSREMKPFEITHEGISVYRQANIF